MSKMWSARSWERQNSARKFKTSRVRRNKQIDVVNKYLLPGYETFIIGPMFGAVARIIFFVYDGFGMKTFCFVCFSFVLLRSR